MLSFCSGALSCCPSGTGALSCCLPVLERYVVLSVLEHYHVLVSFCFKSDIFNKSVTFSADTFSKDFSQMSLDLLSPL